MKFDNPRVFALSLAATVMVPIVPASATTFVDTGVQSSSNTGSVLWTTQYLAGRFTLSSASVISEVLGFIASFRSDTIRVVLNADNGTAPGAALFSADFSALSNATPAAWQGVSGQNWAVDAGTYWISFENLTGNGAYMPATAPRPLSAYAYSRGQGASWINSAVNFGLRVNGDVSVSAVPEPATWAMMVAGFGMVGFAMRHAARRSSVRFNAKIKRIANGAQF